MRTCVQLKRCVVASALAAAGWCASLPMASAEAAGQWQERSQIVWSEAERKLVRQTFRVWDPHPELNLEFRWEGHSATGSNSGRGLSGSGRLIWQAREAAPYDKLSVYSEYRGDLANGRPHGFGSITVETGLSYEGEWKNGLMEGVGALRLPNGDEYAGDFLAGRPHGSGRYAAADGSVFEGAFRDGHRVPLGVLPGADGHSLRTVAGEMTSPSPAVTAAHFKPGATEQPIQLAQAPGGIMLRVFMDRQKNQSFIKEDADNKSFVYEQTNAPDRIQIRLASREIMGLWKGNAPVRKEGIRTFEKTSHYQLGAVEQYAPVFLVVDIANDSARAAQIVGGHIDVEESLTDLQPLVTIKEAACDRDCGAFQPDFEFVNSGWGGVRGARVSYAFGDQSGARGPAFTINAGSFDQTRKVSVLEGLQASGVNIGQLKTRTFKCRAMAQVPACARQVAASGILGRLSDAVFTEENHLRTRVTGKIEYNWADSRGTTRQRESAISVDIPLLDFEVPDVAEMGAPGPVERKLNPLKLSLDRKNYRIPVNYRARLEPRENKRFALALTADKSSQHFFTVVLATADGSTVTSPKFDLLYFIPRTIPTN
jgi:hypothetical protein